MRNSLAFSSSTATQRNAPCGDTTDCATATGSKAYDACWECASSSNAFYHDAHVTARCPTASVSQLAFTPSRRADHQGGRAVDGALLVASIGATVFLKDSQATEGAVFVVGVAMLAASVSSMWLSVRWMDTYYNVP